MNLEERLSQHMEQQLHGADTEITSVAAVRTRARRKSLRTRMLVGVCGLAALGGLGTLVPTGSEPSALVTADRPSIDGAASNAQSTPDTVAPTPTPFPLAGQPHMVYGDGQGGFVGVFSQRNSALATSVDGEQWTPSLDWRAPTENRYLQQMWTIDDALVAITSQYGNDGLIEPEVLVFRTEGLGIEGPERIALDLDLPGLDVDVDVEGITGDTWPMDLVGVGDTLVLSVFTRPNIDYAVFGTTERKTCIHSETITYIAITLCDGTEIEIARGDDLTALGLDYPQRFFVSANGEPFEEIRQPRRRDIRLLHAIDDQFVLVGSSDTEVLVSNDGVEWEPSTMVNPALVTTSHQDRLVALTGASRLDTAPDDDYLLGVEVHVDGRVIEAELPMVLDTRHISIEPQIAAGPAGYALFVSTADPTNTALANDQGWGVATDEWFINKAPGWAFLQAHSVDTTETHTFGWTRSIYRKDVATGIQRGFFGGYRVSPPGAVEPVLVSGDEIRTAMFHGGIASARDAVSVFDERSIEQDGWQLVGNPVSGPLTLQRPDGTSTTYADGFAFTNGDLTDGVETDLFLPPASREWADAKLQFADADGTVEWELTIDDYLEAMFGDDTFPGIEGLRLEAEDPNAWVLFSPDGVQWRVLAERSHTWSGIPTIAVGDDEVVLALAGFGTGTERIALDE